MTPLADAVRPAALDEICGQTHLFAPESPLRRILESGHLPNLVFYGPPGTGKTTAAEIIAKNAGKQFYKLNATASSVAELRDALGASNTLAAFAGTLLYIDEIQYFNKKQQQSLLEYLEDGRVTMVCSTTENPHFALYPALLSRCACFEFKPLSPGEMISALRRGFVRLTQDYGAKKREDGLFEQISRACGGDLRRALLLLENVYFASGEMLGVQTVSQLAQNAAAYGGGDENYDLLSALQKSIRGSDPDAAVFYLARLLEGGGIASACRRLVVIASEDVGLAFSNAAVVTQACVESALRVGMPEAAIPLAHAAVLLAVSPKSNSAHAAYGLASRDVKDGRGKTPPPTLVNRENGADSHTSYLYPHDYPGHYVAQDYLPDDIKDRVYFHFGDNKTEKSAKAYWDKIKGK